VNLSTSIQITRQWGRRIENGFILVVFAILVGSPLLDVALRYINGRGLSASQTAVQHMTLILATLGGALAARESKLLSLATASAIPEGPWKNVARVFSTGLAAAISGLLALTAWFFVMSEKEFGETLAYGIPAWTVELVMPIGFLLIAIRLISKSDAELRLKTLAGVLAVGAGLVGILIPVPPGWLVWLCGVLLLLAAVLGAPVFTVLGGAALVLFWAADVTTVTIPVEMYRLVVSPTLPTIPLFTLAGYLLAEGGSSKRLVRVFQAMFGWLRGGPVIMTTLACAFFTAFTGASGVTILALGGLLYPVLTGNGYKDKDALGMLTAGGSLGLLFPPSLAVILYGVVSHTPIDKLFLGGLIPGFVLVGLLAAWGIYKGDSNYADKHPFDFKEVTKSAWAAKWELALPLVVMIGLFGGIMTLVETAALTAFYAFVVETFIYKDLGVKKDIPRVMGEAGVLVGGVLLILGVALGLTSYLVDAEVPTRAAAWVQASIESKLAFLLLLNLFLIIVGCLMDIFSAIIVVVPLIIPIARLYGIDPVHLGIIFLANMELGYLTPPVGMNLFLSSYRFKKPLTEVYRSVVPMLAVLTFGVLLITYWPALTTWLPSLMDK
jgi:C4-dicarboxylate transporter DctM subunit